MPTETLPAWDETISPESETLPAWNDTSEEKLPAWNDTQPHVEPIGQMPPSRFGPAEPPQTILDENLRQNLAEPQLPANPMIELEPSMRHPELSTEAPNIRPLTLGENFALAGEVSRAVPADVAYTLSRNPQNLFQPGEGMGNVTSALQGERLPIDAVIEQAAEGAQERGEFPTAAAIAQTSQGLAATAPLLAGIGIAPKAIQTLAGLGFTIDMLRNLPKTGAEFFAELSLPPQQRNPQKLAQLFAQGIQELGFGTLGALHAIRGGKAVSDRLLDQVPRGQGIGSPTPLERPSIETKEPGTPGAIVEPPKETLPQSPVTPEVQAFIDAFNAGPVNNTHTKAAGPAVRTMADLEALKAAQIAFTERVKAARERRKENPDEYTALLGKAQFIRETVENATASGSWKTTNLSRGEKADTTPRVLDYTKNPEVLKWLIDNAETFNFDKPIVEAWRKELGAETKPAEPPPTPEGKPPPEGMPPVPEGKPPAKPTPLPTPGTPADEFGAIHGPFIGEAGAKRIQETNFNQEVSSSDPNITFKVSTKGSKISLVAEEKSATPFKPQAVAVLAIKPDGTTVLTGSFSKPGHPNPKLAELAKTRLMEFLNEQARGKSPAKPVKKIKQTPPPKPKPINPSIAKAERKPFNFLEEMKKNFGLIARKGTRKNVKANSAEAEFYESDDYKFLQRHFGRFFSNNGNTLDNVLDWAKRNGHLAEGAKHDDLIAALKKAASELAAYHKGNLPEQITYKFDQHLAKSAKRTKNVTEHATNELALGTTFKILGEKFEVTHVAEDGVQVKSDKFGVQDIAPDDVIKVDKGSFKKPKAPPTDEGTPFGGSPKSEPLTPRRGKHQADQFELPGQEGVFNLAGEKVEEAPKTEVPKKEEVPPEQEELFGAESGQGAIAPDVPGLQPAAAPVQLTPKSQRQIITDLAKGLGVPIRFGRLKTNKFAGYFQKIANLIAAKRANHLPIVSHEIGHKLDDTFRLSSNATIARELDVLGDPSTPGSYSSWTPSKTRAYKMGEGVAEFVRLWLTDPPKALADAPNTHAAFEAALNANKDIGDVMRTAQEDIRVWRTANPQARLRSHISVGTNPNQTRYTLSQLTRDLVDDLHFGRLAMDDAQRLSRRTFDPSENFYQLARNLRGSYGMADTFIRGGVTDFNTKAVQLGTSLEDALKPVAGRINDFRDWIVAKQAQELHRKGKATGLVPSDVDFVVNKFNADPAFNEAFAKIKAWNNALLKYAVDSGLVTPQAAGAMMRMNRDYVPFHRVFEVGAGEPSAVEGGGTGRGLNVGKPGSIRGRYGSPRDIVDPLETMVRNAYALITASEKQAINLAVANLSGRRGMGKWVQGIKAPQQNIKVGLEKLREQLEDAGADLSDVPDDLLLSFFQNSGRAPFGENSIKVIRNGKPEFYRLNKDLFETFHALDLEDSGKLIRMLSAPAQLLRAGVTLAPDFALANALRDTFSSAILSKYNAFPFEVTIRGLGAMINNPKLVAEWAAAGGKNSIEASYFDRTKLQNFLKEKITKDLTRSEQALIMAKSPLTALRWLTSLSEEATRIGEYQKAFNALRRQGMPEGEARRLAAYESRDRQDFAKGGAKTKIVRHLAAFWNAGLQANVKLASSFKHRPLQTIGKGLLYITTAKMLEQAVNWNDDDYWDRPQWERDLFFLIPIGKGDDGHTRFIRIPTPFEPGVIFGTLPGRILQWAKQNDPEAVKNFPQVVLQQGIPNPIPQTLTTIFSDFMSGKKGWDIYRNQTVVPERIADRPPELQYTEQTSLTAKKLGKLLGFSPVKIDHIIATSTGGVGQVLTHQISDRAISAITGEERTARGKVPGGRFVTTPAAVQSQASDDFYNTLSDLRTAKEGLKLGKPTKLDLTVLPEFERVRENIGKLNRQIELTKDPAERTKLLNERVSMLREVMQAYRKQKTP